MVGVVAVSNLQALEVAPEDMAKEVMSLQPRTKRRSLSR
jgi:hypothetical protein